MIRFTPSPASYCAVTVTLFSHLIATPQRQLYTAVRIARYRASRGAIISRSADWGCLPPFQHFEFTLRVSASRRIPSESRHRSTFPWFFRFAEHGYRQLRRHTGSQPRNSGVCAGYWRRCHAAVTSTSLFQTASGEYQWVSGLYRMAANRSLWTMLILRFSWCSVNTALRFIITTPQSRRNIIRRTKAARNITTAELRHTIVTADSSSLIATPNASSAWAAGFRYRALRTAGFTGHQPFRYCTFLT